MILQLNATDYAILGYLLFGRSEPRGYTLAEISRGLNLASATASAGIDKLTMLCLIDQRPTGAPWPREQRAPDTVNSQGPQARHYRLTASMYRTL